MAPYDSAERVTIVTEPLRDATGMWCAMEGCGEPATLAVYPEPGVAEFKPACDFHDRESYILLFR